MKSVSLCCVVELFFCCLYVFDLLFVSTGVSSVPPFLSRWRLPTCASNNKFFISYSCLGFFYITLLHFFTAWVAICNCIINGGKSWFSYVVKIADSMKDDCSTSKLLCFSLVIGDFYDLSEPGLKVIQLVMSCKQDKELRKM